ncbi:hypothetical protein LSS_22900 [Leptospira santarosai serovar Shermani str. LT 821]|uniref:Uncharacterized protein n=1 Tax=Leptospira santarosai serovar Shermani str. LT 821 TaxID=758847 RepID=A0A097ESX8_9LEPT|nr:hypothetical protein LSS_22900 [Leptospira santarosai serovar Shermani str. LT 821]
MNEIEQFYKLSQKYPGMIGILNKDKIYLK